jgi:hypothetical protein
MGIALCERVASLQDGSMKTLVIIQMLLLLLACAASELTPDAATSSGVKGAAPVSLSR